MFFKSKKFWATLSGCAAVIGGQYLGLDEGTVTKLVAVIASYVIGQGVADVGKNSK